MVQAKAESTKEKAHFKFHIPAGFSLTDVSPKMMDFYLFKLARETGNGPVLTIYVGGHPKFPSLKWSVKPDKKELADRSIMFYAEAEKSQAIETLVDFHDLSYKSDDASPWEMIHFYSEGLSQNDFKVFSEFISRVEIAKKHLD